MQNIAQATINPELFRSTESMFYICKKSFPITEYNEWL